jgi:hypothetical protein
MRTIKVGDKVWNMIVENGKFGETADDVLRRLLNLNVVVAGDAASAAPKDSEPPNGARQFGWKERRATVRMTQSVENGELVLRFDSGQTEKWKLPAKNNPAGIRIVRDKAIAFVRKNGGTTGQEHAAIRALTSRGYRVTGSGKLSDEELRKMFV